MNKLKIFGIMAASLICAGALTMQTIFAQDVVKSLSIKGLTVYENTMYETVEGNIWTMDVPEAAKGKVFDVNGNVVEVINDDNVENLYNKDGVHIWVEDDGTILNYEEMIKKSEEQMQDAILVITDLKELDKYIGFKTKVPEYIPEGFEFVKAEYENYEKMGMDKSYWYSLIYKNKESGKELAIHIDGLGGEAETAFNHIEMGKINGNDAIISDGEVAWSDGENEYIVFMYDLGREEGIKIAESIK